MSEGRAGPACTGASQSCVLHSSLRRCCQPAHRQSLSLSAFFASPLSAARRDDRRRTNPRPYNTAFRVVVSGLPPTASWQDLKDHMRKGGEVTFAQVRGGCGARSAS